MKQCFKTTFLYLLIKLFIHMAWQHKSMQAVYKLKQNCVALRVQPINKRITRAMFIDWHKIAVSQNYFHI